MLLERYYDESLAQASYLIGCEATRQAIVIDPNRDVESYARAAAARRMTIAFVTETHIHADYLSGSLALARQSGASLLLSGHGGPDWSYRFAQDAGARLLRDKDVIDVGRVRLTVRHTPGHTPEHIAFVVTDTATGERPIGMVTGDFVFVGDVGRPDLLEKAAKVAGTMDGAARQLYASLQALRELPDYLQLWPGHGAGSACGKSLGAMPQTTLGYERLYNPAFQHRDEDSFARWVLADQPEPPPYFATMKRLNRDGPPAPRAAPLADVDPATVLRGRDANHWIVDIRSSRDFAKEHLRGSVNIPSSRSLPTYAGAVLDYDRPIALIAGSREQAMAATRQLSLIGFDDLAGWVAFESVRQAAPRQMTAMPVMDAATVAARAAEHDLRIVDVRGLSEWNEGHVGSATHIYLGALGERLSELERDAPHVVMCQSGSRSSIGSSLLRARGFTNVANFSGGMDAWRKAGLPVAR